MDDLNLEKKIADSYEFANNVLEYVPAPLVSVRTSTYNHGLYIRQCIEGVLMQKTNFQFEYIIGEDFSDDETRQIVFEYAKKYPNIIRVITADYNVGSKANGRRCMRACRGKYMAICEGDDYWTDPLKLQKQVDFLESHPDYSMCFHAAILRWERNEHPDTLFYKVEKREYSGTEIFKHWIIATASVVFKSEVLQSDLYKKIMQDRRFVYGDTPLFLCNAKLGRVYGLKDVMSVYRKHEGGAIFSNDINYDINRELKNNMNDIAVYELFGDEYKQISINRICKRNIYNYLRQNKEGRLQYRHLLSDAFRLNCLLATFYYLYVLIRYSRNINERKR